MSDYFHGTGATLLLKYGGALAELENRYLAKKSNDKELIGKMKEVSKWQDNIEFFFEAEHRQASLKHFICRRDSETTRIDVRITAIVAFLFHKLLTDCEENTYVGIVCNVVAMGTGSNPLEIRRKIVGLLMEGRLIKVEKDDDATGYNSSIGLHDNFLRGALGDDVAIICQKSIRQLQEGTKKKVEAKQQSEQRPLAKPSTAILSPMQIYNELKKYVVSQDYACKILATRGFLHMKRAELLKAGKDIGKNECLLLISDSSGCGKTLMANTYSKVVNIPFSAFDATQATATGVVGLEVIEDSIKNLIKNAGDPKDPKTLEVARYGCLFFDEWTKKVCRIPDGLVSRDISGQSVQQEILKCMEGSQVQLGKRRYDSALDGQTFNSNGTFFIFAGFVENYNRLMKKIRFKDTLGFNAQEGIKRGTYLYDFLVSYGLLEEFVNRLSCIIPFRKLNLQDFIDITKHEYGAIAEYNRLLQQQGLSISFTDEAIREMALVCTETGQARTIHYLVSSIVQEAVFNGDKGKIIYGIDDVRNAEGRIQAEAMHLG